MPGLEEAMTMYYALAAQLRAVLERYWPDSLLGSPGFLRCRSGLGFGFWRNFCISRHDRCFHPMNYFEQAFLSRAAKSIIFSYSDTDDFDFDFDFDSDSDSDYNYSVIEIYHLGFISIYFAKKGKPKPKKSIAR